MSMPERFVLLFAFGFCAAATLAFAQGPQLGRVLESHEISALPVTVWPTGRGLPPGEGSVAQGEALFLAQCAACHGPGGVGGTADELSGGQMGLTSEWPDKTIGTYWPYATTVFDFIRRAMPMTAPGSLSADDTYALTAYLLHRNELLPADAILDAASLAAVRMPNREGFDRMWPEPPGQSE